jgi:hypothetical protein
MSLLEACEKADAKQMKFLIEQQVRLNFGSFGNIFIELFSVILIK